MIATALPSLLPATPREGAALPIATGGVDFAAMIGAVMPTASATMPAPVVATPKAGIEPSPMPSPMPMPMPMPTPVTVDAEADAEASALLMVMMPALPVPALPPLPAPILPQSAGQSPALPTTPALMRAQSAGQLPVVVPGPVPVPVLEPEPEQVSRRPSVPKSAGMSAIVANGPIVAAVAPASVPPTAAPATPAIAADPVLPPPASLSRRSMLLAHAALPRAASARVAVVSQREPGASAETAAAPMPATDPVEEGQVAGVEPPLTGTEATVIAAAAPVVVTPATPSDVPMVAAKVRATAMTSAPIVRAERSPGAPATAAASRPQTQALPAAGEVAVPVTTEAQVSSRADDVPAGGRDGLRTARPAPTAPPMPAVPIAEPISSPEAIPAGSGRGAGEPVRADAGETNLPAAVPIIARAPIDAPVPEQGDGIEPVLVAAQAPVARPESTATPAVTAPVEPAAPDVQVRITVPQSTRSETSEASSASVTAADAEIVTPDGPPVPTSAMRVEEPAERGDAPPMPTLAPEITPIVAAAIAPAAAPEARPMVMAAIEAAVASAPADVGVSTALDLAHESAWLDRLARDIAVAAGNQSTLRFQLNPEHLGSLHVEITPRGDGLAVQLSAENEAARRLLADAGERLIAESRAQGGRIVEARVESAPPPMTVPTAAATATPAAPPTGEGLAQQAGQGSGHQSAPRRQPGTEPQPFVRHNAPEAGDAEARRPTSERYA